MDATLFILHILLFTAEALLVSTLLPLLVFAVALTLRRRAALRHLVWLACFCMLLLLPALALIVPSQFVLAQAPLANVPSLPVAVAMAAPVTATYAGHWGFDQIVAFLFAPLCAIWFLGVCWNLMRLGLGAFGLHRLRGKSEYFDRAQGCEIRLADGGPLTYGWLKPVILLPFAARRWSRARLDAVLRHELAHVRRKDSLSQTLVQLVCAFYWPNPLVWLAARALRREAEIAADDSVLASGVKPSSYAAELLQLAGERCGRPRFAFATSVAMASPSSLESRVTAVLSPSVSREGATVMDAFKIGLLGSCATALLLVTRPSFAEARKPLPPPSELAAPVAADAVSATPTPVAPMAPVMPERPARPVRAQEAVQENGERAREHAQQRAEAMQERIQERAQAAQERTQERVEASHERAVESLERANTSLAHAKEASDRALSPERVERIVARAQEHAKAAMTHYDAAMERAERAQGNPPPGMTAQEWRATLHQGMEQGRPDVAQIIANVRVQVTAALQAARASRDAALAQARVEIDRSMAQAHSEMRERPAPRTYPAPPAPPALPAMPALPASPAPPPPT